MSAKKLLEGTVPEPWDAEVIADIIADTPEFSKSNIFENAALIAAAPRLARENVELVEALRRVANHETRSDRRHRGMIDASEVEDLRRIARALLARIEESGNA